MSDVVLSALIATIGGVITAAITALVSLINSRHEFELRKIELDMKAEQKGVNAKGEKVRNFQR